MVSLTSVLYIASSTIEVDKRCIGNNIKLVEDMYLELYTWLTGGRELDRKINKMFKHHNNYPDARYVWLNLIPCNFNRSKILATSSKSKDKSHALNEIKKSYTVEFRNHPATLSYNKVSKWVLLCMALVNYVENNSYIILEKRKITLAEIISSVYGDWGNFLIDYVETCKEKYNHLSHEESAIVEDAMYKTDVKETTLFTNKLEILNIT